jgi:pseudaminic acid cytidylyltransferase
MDNLCVIPARGGSKRIPRKNIKDFLGKPIIAYSIDVALKSGLFNEVVVSTDDSEIAEVATKYGALVPFFRSSKNADDFAPLADVVDEVKAAYLERGRSFDNICCILPTAPLLSSDILKDAYTMFQEKEADSVRPVVRYSYPIQRAFRMNEGLVEMVWPENRKVRSQDLEVTYHDAGQFYWMNFKEGLRGEKKIGLEITEMQVQDIDTIDDWKVAEFKYSFLSNAKLQSI